MAGEPFAEPPPIPQPGGGDQAPGMPAAAESPVILVPIAGPRPWGPWATLGWTALCLGLMFAVQIGVGIVYAVVRVMLDPKVKIAEVATDGDVVSIASLVSTVPLLVLIALLIAVRHYPLRSYLALNWPTWRQVLAASAALVLVLAASDFTSYLVGRPIVPPVMVQVYNTAWFSGLVFALLIVAPLGEETLMRGFLFKGIAASWGTTVAILLSSVVWAVIHIQYDLYWMGMILVTGFFLGWVRSRTGSVPLTMLLHAIANAVATAELLIQTHWMH